MDIGNIQLTDKEIQAGNINIPVIKGAPGKDGYTPVKGKDYWTTQDKEEIVQEINQDVNDKLEAKADKIDVETQLDTKVDKEEGKGLSEENFTKEDKQKLENIVPETTKSLQGTSFHMPDSAAAPMKISPRGNDIVQDTREGHNLFNVNDTKTVSSGITVDEEDWITITCDNSSGTSAIYQNYFTNNLNLKENTNYNIIAEIKKVSGTGNIQIVSSSSTSQFNQSIGYLFSDLSNGRTVQLNKLTKSDFTNTTQGIRTFCSFNAGESGSITFRISVLEDTTITSDNFVYAKFGKSPSLNYPSELKYVDGNYDIEVGNKNLLKLIDKTYTSQGVTTIIKDGLIYCSGITTQKYFDIGNSTNNSIKINVSANTNYIFSRTKASKYNLFVKLYTRSGDKYFQFVIPSNELSCPIKVTKDCNHCYMWLSGFDTGDTISIKEFGVQVEKGEIATDYIKHQEQIYPLDLTNHPLYSEKDYIYKKDNKWYVHNDFKKVNAKDLSWSMNEVGLEGITYKQFYAKTTFEPQTFLPDNIGKIFSNTFKTSSASNNKGNYMYIGNTGLLVCPAPKNANGNYITTLAEWNTATQDTYFIGKLANPTETEITDKKVIAQLEELYNTYAYDEITNISVDNPVLSAELVLDVLYYQKTALGLETKVSYEEYSKLQKRVEELENVILTLGGTI